jgi:hypothetical protein
VPLAVDDQVGVVAHLDLGGEAGHAVVGDGDVAGDARTALAAADRDAVAPRHRLRALGADVEHGEATGGHVRPAGPRGRRGVTCWRTGRTGGGSRHGTSRGGPPGAASAAPVPAVIRRASPRYAGHRRRPRGEAPQRPGEHGRAFDDRGAATRVVATATPGPPDEVPGYPRRPPRRGRPRWWRNGPRSTG